MIKMKNEQTNNSVPIYKSWLSDKIPCRNNDELANVTDRLLKKLTHYLDNHPKFKLVSYNFIHDNGRDYYDWMITAIFEVK